MNSSHFFFVPQISCKVSAKFTTSPKNVWSPPKQVPQPFFAGLKVTFSSFKTDTNDYSHLHSLMIILRHWVQLSLHFLPPKLNVSGSRFPNPESSGNRVCCFPNLLYQFVIIVVIL